MATTDIDGTPLFMLGASEAEVLLGQLEDAQLTIDYFGGYDEGLNANVAKLKKFLADPKVVKWLEDNS
jgi:hypothetical protein